MTAPSDDETQQVAPETARQLRAVLAELDDPDDELTSSAATRHRIEGAALEALAAGQPPAGVRRGRVTPHVTPE